MLPAAVIALAVNRDYTAGEAAFGVALFASLSGLLFLIAPLVVPPAGSSRIGDRTGASRRG